MACHPCALTTATGVKCRGMNRYQQLDDSDQTDRAVSGFWVNTTRL